MKFDYENILIMGYGKSGKAVEKILKKLNVNYKIFDKDKKINGGHYYSKLNKKKLAQFDLIVISPGISIYNKYVCMAERMGIKVVGELEFGYWFTDSPVIAITGTNGKTTTTSLINNIVSTTFSCDAFGNIGNPLCNAHSRNCDYLICEVSSFQLESTYSFKPYISVLLNIAEDHLDRHKNFGNYIKSKIGLLKNCNEKSIMVFNADDKIIMKETENIKGKKYYISKFKKVKGVYVSKDKIYANLSGSPIEIMTLDELNNFTGIIDDVLAGILVSLILKIDKQKIVETIKKFKVSPHRMSVVYEKNNIKYIDDSKSTNIHSTMNALNSYRDNVVLLLGGEDKKLKFDEIFRDCKDRLKYVVAFGKTRKKIISTSKKFGFENIRVERTFVGAVKLACKLVQEKDTLLLSPACSSFDEFDSYAERGEKFQQLIKEYVNAKN